MSTTDRLNAMQQRCDAATELTLGDDNAHLAYAVASEDLPATIAALRAVLDLADQWERGATRWENPLPIPPEVALIRDAITEALT